MSDLVCAIYNNCVKNVLISILLATTTMKPITANSETIDVISDLDLLSPLFAGLSQLSTHLDKLIQASEYQLVQFLIFSFISPLISISRKTSSIFLFLKKAHCI